MWAEITIESKRDLPAELAAALSKRFDPSSDRSRAIAETVWASASALHAQVLFAHQTNARVFLVFSPERRTLKVHVECPQQPRSPSVLKRHVEELCEQMRRFLSYHNNRVTTLQIVVGVDDMSETQVGSRLSWRSKLARSIKDQALPKVYVPVVTYGASVMLSYTQAAAFRNVVVAIGATALWVLIDATFFRRSFEYEER